jgi:ribosomal protein L37AE/L43A
MTLFCKQCNSRRLPIYQAIEKNTFWHCEKCQNFADGEDVIIRELTKAEIDEINKKLEDFKKNVVLTGEKMSRRKGVN